MPEKIGPDEIVGELVSATEKLLEALDIEGTCQVCEQSYKFHSYQCPIHAVRLALGQVDEMDAYWWLETDDD